MDTTRLDLKCSLCGNPVDEGRYYQKGEVRTCVTCSNVVTPDQARALAHDQMRKVAESAGVGNGVPKARTGDEAAKLCLELELEARKLAVMMVREAGLSVYPLTPAGIEQGYKQRTLDEAERMVKLAAELDLLADKVLVR